MVKRDIALRFWDRQSAHAADPRATTLDKGSAAAVAREVRIYQQWLFRRLDAAGAVTARVADLGCGNGDWTVILAQRAQHLLAVDFSPGFAAFTAERVRAEAPACAVEVQTADLATITLAGPFDLVVVGAVTQYLDDAEVERLYAQIAAALRPGGRLYFRSTICQRGDRFTKDQAEFQGVYRSAAWYLSALAGAGFIVDDRARATSFVAHEWAHAHLTGLARPLRAPVGYLAEGIRRGYRRFKQTDVLVCLAHTAGG